MTIHDKIILKTWIGFWVFTATLMLPTDMLVGLLAILALFCFGGQMAKSAGPNPVSNESSNLSRSTT